jgi:hypothetical protein
VSLDVRDGAEGTRRWEAAGRPIVPSVSVDGVVEPVLHVSQLAAAVGVPVRPTFSATLLARDTLVVLDAWLAGIRPLTLEELLEPTPARGRSLRNLTVNVFHPFELLPAAWTTGVFPWDPEEDVAREQPLTTADILVAHATAARASWGEFVRSRGAELSGSDPAVVSPRGDVAFSVLLDVQRWHAAFHLRQLETVLGVHLLPELAGLALPDDVF